MPRLFFLLLPVACFLMPAGRAQASSPRDDLLRFVPDEVGFCLIVQDLRGQSARFLASPLAKVLATTPMFNSDSDQLKKLAEAEKYFQRHLGVGWKEIRDDLLGDAFAFAYQPGPPDKPEQERGLFLLRAPDGKKLADFVKKLNDIQKQSGELKEVSEREHKGVKYFRRAEKRETNFYLLREGVLVFSGQEAMLHTAIEHELALPKDAESGIAKRFTELGQDKVFAALLIQPRAFDAHLVAKDDPASKTVAQCWKALDGLALSLNVGKEIEFSLALKGKLDRMPAGLRKLCTGDVKTSELWSAFPDDALIAVAGRLNVVAAYEALGAVIPQVSKETLEKELDRTLGAMLGKNIVKEVLPAIGPDWGFCISAPPADAKDWTPRVVTAVRVARGNEDAPVDQAMFGLVETWAQLSIVAHNKQHSGNTLALKTTHIDKVKARYFEGDGLPVGVRPAFGLRGEYLVLSSTLDDLKRFKTAKVSNIEGAVPLLRVSVKRLREYMDERREPLSVLMATQQGVTKQKASERLDEVRQGLALIDGVELRWATAGDRATLTLAVRSATQGAKR